LTTQPAILCDLSPSYVNCLQWSARARLHASHWGASLLVLSGGREPANRCGASVLEYAAIRRPGRPPLFSSGDGIQRRRHRIPLRIEEEGNLHCVVVTAKDGTDALSSSISGVTSAVAD
jgi:hypothetical protein